MKPSESLEIHKEDLRKLIASHKAKNPRIFGSVLHGTDSEKSDIDILIDPLEGMSLLDLADMQQKAAELLGCNVDITIARSLKKELKDRILSEALPL